MDILRETGWRETNKERGTERGGGGRETEEQKQSQRQRDRDSKAEMERQRQTDTQREVVEGREIDIIFLQHFS